MTTGINGEMLFSAVESAKHDLEIGSAFVSKLYTPHSGILNGSWPGTLNGTEVLFDNTTSDGVAFDQVSVSADVDRADGVATGNSFAGVGNLDGSSTRTLLFENEPTNTGSFHEIVSGAFRDWQDVANSTGNHNEITETWFDRAAYSVVDNASNIGAEHGLMNPVGGPTLSLLNSINASAPGSPLGEPNVSLLSSVNPSGPGDPVGGPTFSLLNSVNPSGPGATLLGEPNSSLLNSVNFGVSAK
jgi:hypothetical protein